MCAYIFFSAGSAPDIVSIPFSSYFSKGDHQGVSIFRRRGTSEQGHRGFRLSSLGILLAKSSRPRPWRHVPSLKSLIRSMYSRFKEEGIYDPGEFDWSSAESFFEQRKYPQSGSSDLGAWRGWSDELDSVSADVASSLFLPYILCMTDLKLRPSLIRISTTPPHIYPTSSASSDFQPLRYTNTSSAAGES